MVLSICLFPKNDDKMVIDKISIDNLTTVRIRQKNSLDKPMDKSVSYKISKALSRHYIQGPCPGTFLIN